MLDDLHDIEGLAPISMWPLAFGWWISLTIIIVGLVAVTYFLVQHKKYKASWKFSSRHRLNNILHDLEKGNKDSIKYLTTEIRAIAMHYADRQEIASLAGDDWVRWLSANDPYGFAWEKYKNIVGVDTYAPIIVSENQDVIQVVNAIKRWIKK